jgi:hypothetical protein
MSDELAAQRQAALERERLGYERRLLAAKEAGDDELAGRLEERIAAVDDALKPKAKKAPAKKKTSGSD